MNDKTNTGGPAFPVGFQKDDTIAMKGGMTLRDYFAAKVLAAFINNATGVAFGVSHLDTNTRFATAAYAVADAMLKVREVTQ